MSKWPWQQPEKVTPRSNFRKNQ